MSKEPNLYKRGKIWHLKIERQGRKVRESTGETTLAGAREYRDRALNKLKKLRNGLRDDITYDTAMTQFLLHCESTLKPGGLTRYKVSARAMHHNFTGMNLGDITKADIVTYLDGRKRELTGSGVNRERALLSSMYSFAVDRDFVQFNPVLNIKRYRESEPRTRNLSKAEFKEIKSKCNKLLADMAEFDTETGLRATELVDLKWPQIDLRAHQITLDETKSGKSRIVPLSDRALAILASQIRHTKTLLVFWHGEGRAYRHAPRAFSDAAKAAKVPDVVFHDLRRTFTCWNFSKGVPLHVLSKLLGHSSYAVTEAHYAFLQTDDLHMAIRGVTKSSQSQGTLTVNLSKSTKGKSRKC